jgi:hypothetical protein
MQRFIAALTFLAGTQASFAGPIGSAGDRAGASNESSGPGFAFSGYDSRANPVRGVNANDRVSMTLIQYDANANPAFVNSDGEVRVPRGAGITDGGQNRNGTGRLQMSWDETVSGSRTFIRATISTSNREPLVPASATVPLPGGPAPAVLWSWHFGVVDGVNYFDFISGVRLIRSQISFSTDNGQSYFNTIVTTSSIPNSDRWMPGSDAGQILSSVGDGTNYIFLQYEVSYIPGPASVALIGGGVITMLSGRRRRSS